MKDTGSFWFPNDDLIRFSTTGSDNVTADSYGVALVTFMPYTTTIDKIAVFVVATTLAGDLTARIETVTAANSTPSGTLYHADGVATTSLLVSDDLVWVEFTFAAPVVITGGDFVAFTVGREASSGSTFTGSIRRLIANDGVLPILAVRVGGAWSTATTRAPAIALHSTTDGWLSVPGAPQYASTASQNYNPTTSPDEIGAVLVMPMTARLVAVEFYFGGLTTNDAFTLRLYDQLGSVLWSKSLVAGTDLPTTTGYRIFPIQNRPVLKKGQFYGFLCETTVGTITMNYVDLGSSSYLGSSGLGGTMYWVERTDGGSWIPRQNRIPFVRFQFDQVGVNIPASGFIR